MPPRASRKRAEPEEENAGGRPFWSGTLTFGLVSVPVSLFPAARSNRASLRMLGPDGQPLARKYYAEKTGKDLDADEVVRGFEINKEKFVIVTDEELERLAPEKTRDIDLKQFVPAESTDALGQMLGLSGVFMLVTFVVFAIYGLFAAALRAHVISRPVIMTWMRRTFAAAFVLLGVRLAFAER